MTIKATSALSILAIWIATAIGIRLAHGGWPVIIFAALTTAAVGASAWRRLGMSRLLAIAGTWAAVAIAMDGHHHTWWISIFAFLSTAAVVYSVMRRDDYAVGLGVAVAWLVVGIATREYPHTAWMSVFAFLSAGALSNTRGNWARGVSAILWWSLLLAVVLVSDGGWAWLCVPAFLLTAMAVGLSDFHFPRGIEWDLFDREDDSIDVR